MPYSAFASHKKYRPNILLMVIFPLIFCCLGCSEMATAENIPIGMYGTWGKDSKYYMTVLKDNGFQIAVSTDVEYASKLGLKCLYPLWLTKEIANDPDRWEIFLLRLRNTVEKYKDNHTIVGWYVTDEPDWQQISVAKIKAATELIKSIDKNTPTFVVLTMPNAWRNYLPYFDMIAIDPYLDRSNKYRGKEIDKVADWIKYLKSDLTRLHLNKPIWVVLGAFELRSKVSYQNSAFVKPKPDEFMKMVNIAIKENVNGILVFSLTVLEDSKYFEWNLIRDDPFLWDTVRNVPKIFSNQ
jgi:hypothetical protein